MAKYDELLSKYKGAAAKTPTTASAAPAKSSSYDDLLSKYRGVDTKKNAEPTVKAPTQTVSKSVAPTNANLKKDKISAPEPVKKSGAQKTAEAVTGFVKKFVGNTTNPIMTFAPDLTKKSAGETLSGVVDAAKTSISSAVDAYKRFGEKAYKMATTSYNPKASMADKSAAAIDAAASALADVGGATFQVGLDIASAVSPKFGKIKKAVLDKPVEKIGDVGTRVGSAVTKALPISEEAKSKLEEPISNLASAGLITLVMHRAAKSSGLAGEGKAKPESVIKPFTDVLGIEHKNGKALSEAKVDAAYKTALDEAINRGGTKEQIEARTNVIDSAYQVAKSYATKGEDLFIKEDLPRLAAMKPQAEAILSNIQNKAASIESDVKAATVDSVLRSEATAETRKAMSKFDQDMQFAFEQEILDLNKKNEPKLQEAASKGVQAALERINDPADERPAHYDVLSNTIRLNENTIRKTIDALWQGKTLKIGEGKLVDVFVKRAGESLEDLKTRYEKALVDHEIAHAKTIDPADAARLQVALKTGNTAEVRRLRTELEERASTYVIEEARKGIDETVNKAVDTKLAQIEAKRSIKEKITSLKFPEQVKEDAYKEWKKIVSRETGMERATYDEIQSRIGEKKANALFEDALARGDGNGPMRFDDLINDFQSRFNKEQSIKGEITRLRDALSTKKEQTPSAFETRRINRIVSEELRKNTTGKTEDVSAAVKDRLQRDNALAEYKRLSEKDKLRADRKATMKDIMKIVRRARPDRTKGGTLKGKMTAEAQSIMDRAAKALQADRGETMRAAIDKVREWRNENTDKIELPQELSDLVDIAEVSGIRQQSLKQLEATKEYLSMISGEGFKAHEAKMARRREVRQRLVDASVEHLAGSAEGLPEKIMADLSGKNAAKNAGQSFWWDTAPAATMARYAGKATAKLMKKTINAAERVSQKTVNTHATIEKIGQDIYGKNFAKEFYTDMHKQSEPITMKGADGKDITVNPNRLMAMGVYAGLKDGKYRSNLFSEKGNNWTPEIAKKVTSILTDADKQFIERVVNETYKKQWQPFADAVSKRNDMNLGRVEDFAGPIRYERDLRVNPDESAKDILLDGVNRKLGLTEKSVKSRTNYVGKMKLSDNPIADALNYMRSTEHYIQMGEFIDKWDALVNDPKFANAAKEKLGPAYLNNLKMHVEDIRRGGISKADVIASNSAANKLAGNVAGALIASPKVWIGQLSSIAQFRGEANSGKAFWEGVKNVKKTDALLKKYAPVLESRIGKSISEITSRLENRQGKAGQILENIKEKLAIPLEKMDYYTSRAGAAGLFNDRTKHYQKLGHSLEKSYELAGEDIAEIFMRTQSTKSYLGKSNMEKRAGPLQPLTILRNQPNKVFRAGVEAVQKYKSGEISRKQLATFLYWNNIVQPSLYYSLRAAVGVGTGYTGAALLSALGDQKGAEDQKKKATEDIGFGSLAMGMISNATGAFIAGDALNTVLENGLRGKNYELRPSITSAVWDDIAQIGTQFNAGDIDEASVYGLRALSRSLGVGDPGGIFKVALSSMSANNKARKAQEKKTPEAKAAAREKAAAKRIQKASQ